MSDDGSNHESNQITWNRLTKLRAEIVFEIKELEKRVGERRTKLVHVDAVLRELRPTFQLEGLPVKHRNREPSPYFKRGEQSARIYDALRVHGTVTSGMIVENAMRDKGLDFDHDRPTRTDFVRRFTLQLRAMRQKGILEKVEGRGIATRWRLSKA